jgi:hypothetical protein
MLTGPLSSSQVHVAVKPIFTALSASPTLLPALFTLLVWLFLLLFQLLILPEATEFAGGYFWPEI